jgi:hypothetical protein
MYEQKANVWKSTTSSWCVHVPSCATTKYIANADADTSHDPGASEGAIVDVYDNYIDIRAMDFKNNKYLPIGNYRLDTTLVSVESIRSISDVTNELYWFNRNLDSGTGQPTLTSDASSSAFVIYDNTKQYTLTLDASVDKTRVFYYDSNKTFISCTNQLPEGTHVLEAPENAAYFRVRSVRVGITNEDVYNHVNCVVTEKPDEPTEPDEPTKPAYDLVSTSQSVDSTDVYNGVGYKDNTYISTSSKNESSLCLCFLSQPSLNHLLYPLLSKQESLLYIH